jgi:predicted RNase H-like HicB family nuclease
MPARYHDLMRSYFVDWSEEDGEWVATCSDEPFCSHLASTPVVALAGLLSVLEV